MGLAASQARLLTITSRKSRAQFESMRLSHQKLALSRSLTDVSNEYQNSLDKTKLFYDFYGVNSTDTPLTYNMLMSPSSINNYTPTLISNNQGQIVLSAPYASAAAAAGVPQEGLGCTPSSLMRDAFIQNLAQSGVITQATADAICAVDYNNKAGLGSDNLINTITTYGDYKQLLELLGNNFKTAGVDLSACSIAKEVAIIDWSTGNAYTQENQNSAFDSKGSDNTKSATDITFADLLSGENTIFLGQESNRNQLYEAVNNVLTQLGNVLSGILYDSGDAIAYANSQMESYCWGKKFNADGTWPGGDPGAFVRDDKGNNIFKTLFGKASDKDIANLSFEHSSTDLLFSNAYGHRTMWHSRPNEQNTVNLSAFTQAWFTYFMQYLYGLGSAKSNELLVTFEKGINDKSFNNFADQNNIGDFQFTMCVKKISDNEALVSNFYDTLFNQICVNGWTQNNEAATDANYLKEMLQSGKMYLTSMSDDYYFYQNNYSTNTFVKEVSDDAAIAAAESKYTTEKARINAKEQEIDLKMKNLDTEISSLETEYEAVKKVIEGNVSKSFTRYDS